VDQGKLVKGRNFRNLLQGLTYSLYILWYALWVAALSRAVRKKVDIADTLIIYSLDSLTLNPHPPPPPPSPPPPQNLNQKKT
jgi:hypothetical protein